MSNKILSIVNSKGGAMKTTLAYNAACSMARDQSICLVDFDNQANLSRMFQQEPFSTPTSFDSIISPNTAPALTGIDNVYLYPADKRLKTLESSNDHLIPYSARENFIPSVSGFDYTFIDTPGMDGNRLFVALCLSDFVVIPLQLNDYHLEAMSLTINMIHQIKKTINPSLEFVGIIPSIVHGVTLGMPRVLSERDIYKQLESSYADYLLPIVCDRDAIRVSQAKKLPIDEITPVDQKAIHEFKVVTKCILKRIGG